MVEGNRLGTGTRRNFLKYSGVLGASGLAGCLGGIGGAGSQTLTVRAGWCDVWTLGMIYVGQEKGWFSEGNLETEWSSFCSSSNAVNGVASDQVDIAIGSGTNVANARSRGIDVKMIGPATEYEYRYFENPDLCGAPARPVYWVSLKDSGVESLSDLDGKTISIASFGTFMALTTRAGISQLTDLEPGNDVDLVEMWGMDAVNAMRSGDLHACVLPPSIWSSLDIENEFNVIMTNYDVPPLDQARHTGIGLLSSDSAIEGNSEAMQAWMEGYVKSVDFVHNNPDESTQIWSDAMGASRSVNNIFTPPDYRVGIEGNQALVEWMVRYDVIEDSIDFSDAVDHSLIEAAVDEVQPGC